MVEEKEMRGQLVCGARARVRRALNREYVKSWSSLPCPGLNSRSHDVTHGQQPHRAAFLGRWAKQRTRPIDQ